MKFKILILVSICCFFLSCSKEDDPKLEPVEVEKEPPAPVENPDTGENNQTEMAGETFIFKEDLMDKAFLLVNDALANRVYLMNKKAEILHEWKLETGIGNDCIILENGQLLALLQAPSPFIEFGGFAGKLQLVNPDDTIVWNHDLSNENMISHHDVELLPNGNIVILVWVKKTGEEAISAGFKFNYDVYPESVFELNPSTMEIEWEWHSWDHLIQDHDSSKNNYGVVSDNPHKININYNPNHSGDIMHANGIEYDSKNDLLFLSINFFSEVWVIDHSTTTLEAAGSTGGNYNKGGDLVYRFGNPKVYNNTEGTRLFYNNHWPNIKLEEDGNTMFVFSNGNSLGKSTVYEFKFPQLFHLEPNKNNEPEIIWSFTHPELYSQKVSGAEELPNGNILITEGDYGAWEITREGEIVWKFKGEGFFWRIYPYKKDDPALFPYNINQ